MEITNIPTLIAYADDIPTIDDLNSIEVSFSESLYDDYGWDTQDDGFKRQVMFPNFSVAWLEFRNDSRELVVYGDSPRMNISVTEFHSDES